MARDHPQTPSVVVPSCTSAVPPPHPRGQLPFPPEVLELIFAEVSHLILWDADVGRGDELAERNKVLASLALCSSQFQQAVYSTLYGDLRLDWCANTVPKLLRSLEENPRLLLLVRHLEAVSSLWEGFCNDRINAVMQDADLQEDWFNSYVEKNQIDEEWEGDNPYADVWQAELFAAARAEWEAGGLDAWEGRPSDDVGGLEELVSLLERTSNLRSVTISGFERPLPDFLAGRGPFPSIVALDLFNDADVVERPANLASLLLSRTPSLQHLSTSHVPAGSLPPLISLRFRRSCKSIPDANATRLTEVLQLLRPSLRCLDVDLHAVQNGTFWHDNIGWAALLAPFVSTLERLTLTDGRWGTPCMRPNHVNELAPQIASSTSLAHLNFTIDWIRRMPPPDFARGIRGLTLDRGAEAVWSPEPLLISLPSTVRSITFAEDSDTPTLELGERLERMLDALKSTSARPLRVEMKVTMSRRGSGKVEVFRDRRGRALEFVETYAREGITLVV
ncbi:hypothetical protein RQP46_003551 [Phenoliferia psychrophenolica]